MSGHGLSHLNIDVTTRDMRDAHGQTALFGLCVVCNGCSATNTQQSSQFANVFIAVSLWTLPHLEGGLSGG